MTLYSVQVPFTDLRKEPVPAVQKIEKDPLQETQLLQGERVRLHKLCSEWAFIEALDQPVFSQQEKEWMGYPGWVRQKDLNPVVSFDKSPNTVEKLLDRKKLIEEGSQWIGAPYFWGGLVPTQHGIDCSGLVHLLYRKLGIVVPRNAHDQYLYARKTCYEQLMRGDPIFLAEKSNPEKICHIMLFIEGDVFLEATMDSNTVRVSSGQEKLGGPLTQKKCFDQYHLYFGSFF